MRMLEKLAFEFLIGFLILCLIMIFFPIQVVSNKIRTEQRPAANEGSNEQNRGAKPSINYQASNQGSSGNHKNQ